MSSNKELVKDLREAQEQVAQLQAELQRHKFAIGLLYKCFRKNEPMPRLWVDEAFALKEEN